MAVRVRVGTAVGTAAAPKVRVRVATAKGGSAGRVRVRVATATGATAGMLVDAGLGGQVNPFDTVILSAVVRTSGVAADSWLWSVESITSASTLNPVVEPAPAIVIVGGDGPGATFEAPPTLYGCWVTFRATAMAAGVRDSSDLVTYRVLAHPWDWTKTPDDVWVARRYGYTPLDTPVTTDTAYGAGAYGAGPYGG